MIPEVVPRHIRRNSGHQDGTAEEPISKVCAFRDLVRRDVRHRRDGDDANATTAVRERHVAPGSVGIPTDTLNDRRSVAILVAYDPPEGHVSTKVMLVNTHVKRYGVASCNVRG